LNMFGLRLNECLLYNFF
jgi:CTP-dependent riboflavin kinase